ncbi:MAG TPA: spore coat protein [Lachnospiraceae bacterium]|nr:spore coat protein [Lachnospiraceae bacterium]
MISNVTLTTKEKFLLEDMKSNEEQCILKYDNYQNQASDPQLKSIFRSNGQMEQEHLQTINQLMNGKVPSMSGGQSGGQQSGGQQQQPMQQKAGQSGTSQAGTSSSGSNISDKDMCMDMLSTEKYVSGTYNTAIFEFKDTQVRDVLNHIQKEEQQHGEAISSYMISKGMYTLK